MDILTDAIIEKILKGYVDNLKETARSECIESRLTTFDYV